MRASERRSDYNRFPPFLPLRSSYAAPLVNLQIFLKSIRGTFCAARVYHHGGKRAQTQNGKTDGMSGVLCACVRVLLGRW